MIRLDVEQGSPEWVAARLGVVTASALDKVLTPSTLKPSKQAETYLCDLVAEWVQGQPSDEFGGTYWTERGHALEDRARASFEFLTGRQVRSCGFVYRDDSRTAGCSPDGLVYDGQDVVAGLELKVPKLATHLRYWRAGRLPTQYRLQIQGCLWVTGLPRWYFMSYGVEPNVPPLVLAVEPEPDVQAALDEVVPTFCDEAASMRARLEAEGVRPTAYIAPDEESWT